MSRQRRSTDRRRIRMLLVLGTGLLVSGWAAALLVPDPQVATAQDDQSALVREGRQLYDISCITCHGTNLQGVLDRGPSLIGVGEASVYFQVSSGRMPAKRLDAQIERHPNQFDDRAVDALGALVQSAGGGPTVIRESDGAVAQESLRGDSVSRGSELFRMNCASCHNFTGRGGALSSGKYAPTLDPATEQQVYQAMQTGPQNMPKFSDRQLLPDEKRDIIAYVKSAQETPDPGGYGLGGFGPATESLAVWIAGIVTIVAAAMWIGVRS